MSENKRSMLLRFLGCAIPVLLVAYVLSVGPVFAKVVIIEFAFDHPIEFASDPPELVGPDSIFTFENYGAFYAPLIWVCEKNPYIGELLSDYENYCLFTLF